MGGSLRAGFFRRMTLRGARLGLERTRFFAVGRAVLALERDAGPAFVSLALVALDFAATRRLGTGRELVAERACLRFTRVKDLAAFISGERASVL